MIRSRRGRGTIALIAAASAVAFSGCTALRAEMAAGDPERQTMAAERDRAFADALPGGEVSVGAQHNGLAQDQWLSVVLPDADALDALEPTTVRAIIDAYCAADPIADYVTVTITADAPDGSEPTRGPVGDLIAQAFPERTVSESLDDGYYRVADLCAAD